MSFASYVDDIAPTPTVGQFIYPDGWYMGQTLQASTWEKAPFRIPCRNQGPITSLAVRVIVTGRTRQWQHGSAWWRCRLIMVGDGEPDTTMGGWMRDPNF